MLKIGAISHLLMVLKSPEGLLTWAPHGSIWLVHRFLLSGVLWPFNRSTSKMKLISTLSPPHPLHPQGSLPGWMAPANFPLPMLSTHPTPPYNQFPNALWLYFLLLCPHFLHQLQSSTLANAVNPSQIPYILPPEYRVAKSRAYTVPITRQPPDQFQHSSSFGTLISWPID